MGESISFMRSFSSLVGGMTTTVCKMTTICGWIGLQPVAVTLIVVALPSVEGIMDVCCRHGMVPSDPEHSP